MGFGRKRRANGQIRALRGSHREARRAWDKYRKGCRKERQQNSQRDIKLGTSPGVN